MLIQLINSIKPFLFILILILSSCSKDEEGIREDNIKESTKREIEWTTQLTFNGKDTRPLSITEIKNQGYLILRRSANIGNMGSYASLSFIDTEGNEIWNSDYEDLRGSVTSNLVSFGNNYAFFTGYEVVVVDINGNIIKAIDTALLSGNYELSGNCGLKSVSDGLLLFTLGGGYIAKINQSGEIVWNNVYNKMISDATEYLNGKYIFTTAFNYSESGYGTFFINSEGEYTDSLTTNGMLISVDTNQNLFLFDYTDRSEYYRIKLRKTSLNGEEQTSYEYEHPAHLYCGQHIYPKNNLFSFIGSTGIHIINYSDDNEEIHEYKCGSIKTSVDTQNWNRAWFGLTPTFDGGFIVARKAVQENSSGNSVIVINKYK
ncbi:hypothetical protein [Carboxylicivirga sp. N1Y90]|uniref:hypothetical protein n=1 Tax=Carboxylicivirga fragile TaxID=3417571 RepID=UPI003D345362|nr:hypothetical protein [Marinilabiliaceae bacterium N1Y90]